MKSSSSKRRRESIGLGELGGLRVDFEGQGGWCEGRGERPGEVGG